MANLKRFHKGIILIFIGLAMIFPFFSKLIFKNIMVIFGFYVIITGMKLLLTKERKPKKETFDVHEDL